MESLIAMLRLKTYYLSNSHHLEIFTKLLEYAILALVHSVNFMMVKYL